MIAALVRAAMSPAERSVPRAAVVIVRIPRQIVPTPIQAITGSPSSSQNRLARATPSGAQPRISG